MSKEQLEARGFVDSHFRSKSKNTDIRRGFGEYVFLTLSQDPRIVQAKLKGGFPHIAYQLPVETFNKVIFDLCRYNVAMVRRTLDSPSGGFPESSSNGRYYDGKKLPIARDEQDKAALLKAHFLRGQMIEVLVRDELILPEETRVECYSPEDLELCRNIAEACEVPWSVELVEAPGAYNRNQKFVSEVESYVQRALADPGWMGDGLEFDRV